LATRAGTEVVQQVLARSLETGLHAAAIGAAEVLGATGDPSVLSSTTGLSPLATALLDRNRRVRFAAAQAIVKLDPPGTFPGASRVAETLGFFTTSTGDRGILVGHPSPLRGRTIGGLAADAGFAPEAVASGAELLRRGPASSDWELILISDELKATTTWQLIELLQADPRTAELPIVLMTARGDEALFQLDKIADSHQRVLAIREPIENEGVNTAISRALALAGRDLVDRDRRLEQAILAMEWMNQLSQGKSKLMTDVARQQDRLIEALYTGALSQTAAELLARIGSPRAQLALADVASQNNMPLAARQAAAGAFDQSIQSFGVLMTRDEIQRQYDRYNASRGLSVETQRILGALLDSLEAPQKQENARW
jgi:CheY-like chemotaxis protein